MTGTITDFGTLSQFWPHKSLLSQNQPIWFSYLIISTKNMHWKKTVKFMPNLMKSNLVQTTILVLIFLFFNQSLLPLLNFSNTFAPISLKPYVHVSNFTKSFFWFLLKYFCKYLINSARNSFRDTSENFSRNSFRDSFRKAINSFRIIFQTHLRLQ